MPKKSELDNKDLSKKKSASEEAKKTKTAKAAPKKTAIKKSTPTESKKKASASSSKKTATSKNNSEKTVVKKTAVKKVAAKENSVKEKKSALAKSSSKKEVIIEQKIKNATPVSASLEINPPNATVTNLASTPKQDKIMHSEALEKIPEGEYMNPAQKLFFKKVLEDWRDELIEDSKRSDEYMRSEKPQTADLNDRASQEEEFYLELRTRERERKLIDKISKALLRLAKNDFGWCEHCGEEIGLKRLVARPTAELCIDCKELAERKEKGYYR